MSKRGRGGASGAKFRVSLGLPVGAVSTKRKKNLKASNSGDELRRQYGSEESFRDRCLWDPWSAESTSKRCRW